HCYPFLIHKTKALLSIPYPQNQGKHTHLAFSEIRTKKLFSKSSGGRVGAKKVVVMITDGDIDDPDNTLREAKLLENTGVSIFSVGVGVTNTELLEALASKPENVFTAVDFVMLDYSKNHLVQTICNK
uniref:VWFA domain-containing protein n=1 Tax=Biomphalaria glabrata TaxID=6526 RepID=A0A2C9L7N8_BIOGL